MKHLRKFFIVGIFTLLASFHSLLAMSNVEATNKLHKTLNSFEQLISKKSEVNTSKWSLIIRELINNGAKANTKSSHCEYCALHYAVAINDVDLINFLLNYGADIEAVDDEHIRTIKPIFT